MDGLRGIANLAGSVDGCRDIALADRMLERAPEMWAGMWEKRYYISGEGGFFGKDVRAAVLKLIGAYVGMATWRCAPSPVCSKSILLIRLWTRMQSAHAPMA